MSFDTKLNQLANTINAKAGKAGKKTIAQLTEEVASLNKTVGTINITENGTIDVTNYASANVNIQPKSFITTNNIHTYKDIAVASRWDTWYVSLTDTFWSTTDQGMLGTYWRQICTFSNVDNVILKDIGQVTSKTYYCVGYTLMKESSDSDYKYNSHAIYLYFNAETHYAYLLVNTATATNKLYTNQNYTGIYIVPYFIQQIILESTGSAQVTPGAFTRYGTVSNAALTYAQLTPSIKPTVVLKNTDSTKTYTLINGFYYLHTQSTGATSFNLMSSTLVEE